MADLVTGGASPREQPHPLSTVAKTGPQVVRADGKGMAAPSRAGTGRGCLIAARVSIQVYGCADHPQALRARSTEVAAPTGHAYPLRPARDTACSRVAGQTDLIVKERGPRQNRSQRGTSC